MLRVLGCAPLSVLRTGGCCSGLARLSIHLLRHIGVRAHQVTLYHRNGHAQHALIELVFPYETQVVDHLYGLSFVSADGLPLGAADLRRGASPQFLSVPFSKSQSYPDFEYFRFDYPNTKTANWSSSRSRSLIYTLLHNIIGDRAALFRQPFWLESPQLTVAIMLLLLSVFLDVLFLAFL